MELSIVIIDDEAEITLGLSEFIKEYSNEFKTISTFTQGVEALNFIKKNNVDIVITDINMPDISGIDIIKELYNFNKNIDIIIISGYREFEYAVEALKYNVHSYIVKPIALSELSANLKDICINRSHKYQENYDSDIYVICKTIIDVYNNSITLNKAKNIFDHVGFDSDNCNYSRVLVKVQNLSKFLEDDWIYGKGQFYDAVSNIMNDTSSLSGNPFNKFYFISTKSNTLEFIYVGNTLEQEHTKKLEKLLADTFNLQLEIHIRSTTYGLCEFASQFIDKQNLSFDLVNEDIIIQKAKTFIDNNYMYDISLYDVASHVNLAYAYCSKLFKQCTGLNFIDYIVDLRLNKAIELLKQKKYTSLEISKKVGYQSYSYFLRLFKSHFGCSPKEFSRRYLIDEE